jgi:DNA-binding PadR family transcriptional regulator
VVKEILDPRGIEIVDPATLQTALNPLAWKILNLINEQPQYPSEIAKKLKVNEQNIYYHIRNLQKAGLIECVSEEKKQGAVCKYFVPTAQAFGVELAGRKKQKEVEISPRAKDFFFEFVRKGVFDGSIVVGSPLPHGPHLTEAQDGHYAIHLAMFLGKFCGLKPDKFIVKLDTEMKAEKKQKRNMILIGGPVTNIICTDVNKKMRVFFDWDKNWFIQAGNMRYLDETAGIIAKVKNPWDETKSIIVLAGVRFMGTKACVLALTQHHEKVLAKYSKHEDFYCVVKGLDRDGDGQLDDIEILSIK